jgi:hypothetical protein
MVEGREPPKWEGVSVATVPNVGLERSAVLIGADCSHMAVGTGTTTESPSDTQLATETYRNSITKKFVQGRKIQERTLITNANLPATMEEFGLFMNGSGSANSGSLLTRTLSTFVKGSQDLLIVVEIEYQEV